MKAHHKLFEVKRFVLAKCPLILFSLALLCLFGFAEIGRDNNPTHLTEQVDETDPVHVQVFDFRGQGDSVAVNSAVGNSKKNVLILLVRSSNMDHIKAVKQCATIVVRQGKSRIALFLGDKPSSIKNDATLFFANGEFKRVVLQRPGTETNGTTLIHAILEEYESHVAIH